MAIEANTPAKIFDVVTSLEQEMSEEQVAFLDQLFDTNIWIFTSDNTGSAIEYIETSKLISELGFNDSLSQVESGLCITTSTAARRISKLMTIRLYSIAEVLKIDIQEYGLSDEQINIISRINEIKNKLNFLEALKKHAQEPLKRLPYLGKIIDSFKKYNTLEPLCLSLGIRFDKKHDPVVRSFLLGIPYSSTTGYMGFLNSIHIQTILNNLNELSDMNLEIYRLIQDIDNTKLFGSTSDHSAQVIKNAVLSIKVYETIHNTTEGIEGYSIMDDEDPYFMPDFIKKLFEIYTSNLGFDYINSFRSIYTREFFTQSTEKNGISQMFGLLSALYSQKKSTIRRLRLQLAENPEQFIEELTRLINTRLIYQEISSLALTLSGNLGES